MGSLVKKVTRALDPGGFTSGREFSLSGAIDPGGQVISDLTGSDIGRQLADPAKILGDPAKAPVPIVPPSAPSIPDVATSPEALAAEQQRLSAQATANETLVQKRRRSKKKTILTGGLGLTAEAKTKKPTILGTVA